MTRTDPSFRRLVELFARGRWDDVADGGEIVAARLVASGAETVAPVAVLLAAWARAEQGYLPTAIEMLERGMRHLTDPTAMRELGDLDAFYLRLVELYLLTGDFPAAREHLDAMSSPDAPLPVRFAAQRGLVSIAVARGDDVRANALLNVVETMAAQAGKDGSLLVAGDRAIWLAATRQPGAAATIAEPVADRFRRRNRERAWRSTHLVSVAAAVALAAAEVGDTSLARTWLTRGGDAAAHLEGGAERRGAAELALARSALERTQGELEAAEASARAALTSFQRLGMRPAAAVTRLQLAKISIGRGYEASTEPAIRSVVAELVEVEQLRAASEADAMRPPALTATGAPTFG